MAVCPPPCTSTSSDWPGAATPLSYTRNVSPDDGMTTSRDRSKNGCQLDGSACAEAGVRLLPGQTDMGAYSAGDGPALISHSLRLAKSNVAPWDGQHTHFGVAACCQDHVECLVLLSPRPRLG